MTPFLTLPESSQADCKKDNSTRCTRYPINALHAHNSLQGRDFFFELHVTNAAGHVTSVNSSSFRLPSNKPPGQAVVKDVIISEQRASTSSPSSSLTSVSTQSTLTGQTDPTTSASLTYVQFSDDVDTIIQRDEIYIAWTGFYHEEDISTEVGLGANPDHDDVVSFRLVKNQNPVRVDVSSLPVYTKIYSVVKATSSGGTSMFSSDGFVVVPQDDPENVVQVYNGKGCHGNDLVGSRLIDRSEASWDISDVSNVTVHAGDVLFVHLSPFVSNVIFHNVTLLQTTLTGYQLVAMTSDITATPSAAPSADVSMQVLHCRKDASVLPEPDDYFTVTWETSGPWTSFVQYLHVEVVDDTCLRTSLKKDKYHHQQCLLHQQKVLAMEGSVRVYNHVVKGHSYVTSISPCVDDGCLPPVASHIFTFVDTDSLRVRSSRASLLETPSRRMEVDVQAFVEPEIMISETSNMSSCVYLWAVCRDRLGSIPVTRWTVGESPACSTIEVKLRCRMF